MPCCHLRWVIGLQLLCLRGLYRLKCRATGPVLLKHAALDAALKRKNKDDDVTEDDMAAVVHAHNSAPSLSADDSASTMLLLATQSAPCRHLVKHLCGVCHVTAHSAWRTLTCMRR